jgi:S1-C subfamily serine protease
VSEQGTSPANPEGGRVTITAEELARVAAPGPPPEAPPRLSHLAVASLVLGLLGAPLAGFVLGPLAVGCGVLALSALQGRRPLRGFGVAVAGVVLGSLDLLGWLVALAFIFGRPSSVSPAPAPVPASTSRAVAGVEEAPPAVRRALHANVFVRCRAGGAESTGSGVVIGRDDGAIYAVSNRHVVECGERGALTVATLGGAERAASLRWSAPEGIDAVLLSVAVGTDEERDAVPVPAGDAPRVGDAVFAVGNPLGYEATYTAGVLSAIRAIEQGGVHLRVLQVQASVSPGHSGGGLYDSRGALVGINTWTAPRPIAEGIGFALSARDVFALLREVDRPWERNRTSRGKEAPP